MKVAIKTAKAVKLVEPELLKLVKSFTTILCVTKGEIEE